MTTTVSIHQVPLDGKYLAPGSYYINTRDGINHHNSYSDLYNVAVHSNFGMEKVRKWIVAGRVLPEGSNFEQVYHNVWASY